MSQVRAPFSATTAGGLRLLGTMASGLAADDLLGNLDTGAELLRRAAEADDCEIYLCEPEGSDLVLATCQGRDRESLQGRTRFSLGIGFPGIAMATGQLVVSRELARDRRFVRRGAVRHGVSAFMAMPLEIGPATMGCACLAWHRRSAPLERGAELLQNTAGLLATVIRSGLTAAREQVDRAVEAAGQGREGWARACLQALVNAAGARGGTLALYHAAGRESEVYSTPARVDVCAPALDGRLRCGAVAEGHGVTLPRCRRDWPAECRCMPETTLAPVCLPLRAHGRLHGVVVLDRGQAQPTPRSRDLVILLAMAREAALHLSDLREDLPPAPAAGASGAILEIRGLGGFELRLNGHPLQPEAFERRKALALLKLLILNQGNPVTRHALAEHLWPGVDEAAGSNRLHGVLHALRTVIEPAPRGRRWVFVCNLGELYYFNMQSPHWVDLFAFRRHAALGHQAARQGRRQEAIQQFEAALALYRGDLFADEPYAAWCDLERSQLRHRWVDLIRLVADLWIHQGEPDRGVAWLRRGLQADPLREDLHQALIRGLVAGGRPQEARAQYQECVRMLREQLEVEPLPETQRLRSLLGSETAPVTLLPPTGP